MYYTEENTGRGIGSSLVWKSTLWGNKATNGHFLQKKRKRSSKFEEAGRQTGRKRYNQRKWLEKAKKKVRENQRKNGEIKERVLEQKKRSRGKGNVGDKQGKSTKRLGKQSSERKEIGVVYFVLSISKAHMNMLKLWNSAPPIYHC